MKKQLVLLITTLLFLAACRNAEPVPATADNVVISELQTAADGDNNLEFVELYNGSDSPVDLRGWSLWYKVKESADPVPLFRFPTGESIPAHGYYLLVREGKELPVLADQYFTEPLFEKKGGLQLQNKEKEVVDRLGWGEAPTDFAAITAAPPPLAGESLSRLPGGAAGNGQATGDNSVDFREGSPNPQNSGHDPAPMPASRLRLEISMPETAAPGDQFNYTVLIINESGKNLTDVAVTVPFPAGLTLLSASGHAADAAPKSGLINWTIPALAAGESAQSILDVQSPYTYFTAVLRGGYVEAEGAGRSYAPLAQLQVAGGAIPISKARELVGQTVTVEGIATMYTGGFFAGSTGNKFYIQDESGGIQIYVPGGQGEVNINIGDRVQVNGLIELYRDSLELIPDVVPDSITVLARRENELPATPITVADNEQNNAFTGRLNMIEGTAVRIDEFSFSYEIDLVDDAGNMTLVYIEKDTGVTAEPLDTGKLYRIIGISEFYSGQRQLKPRLQTDIKEIFPPQLLVEQSAPVNVQPGGILTYTITLYNHTDAPMSALRVVATPPETGIAGARVSDGGRVENTEFVWELDELAGDGSSVTLHYQITLDANTADVVTVPAVTAEAAEWPLAESAPFTTFIGDGVPIWAIQGAGERSPYVRLEAAAVGVVTAVFPELNGFWIQALAADDNPATSEAVFILWEKENSPVTTGQLVRVAGRVREISGQTTLHLTNLDGLTILGENVLPDAVVYDPPRDKAAATIYAESVEGMLVTLAEPAIAVAATNRFGEYALLYEKWGVDLVRRGEENGHLIFIDDGSMVAHGDGSSLPYSVSRGATVSGLTGPLAYTFGQYKIEPLAPPQIVMVETALPQATVAGPGELAIATFNVENLFDILDPHPSSPPKPRIGEYNAKLDRLAAVIEAMGAPAIIAVQEVENIKVLEALVEREALQSYGYTPYLIEGNDSRGIDNGYLVRTELVEVLELAGKDGPDGVMSRLPLLLHVQVGGQEIYLLNNHFSSLSSGEAATEPRRTAQAAWNVALVKQLGAANPAAQFIVLGDLNSFPNTLPLETLQAGGLRHGYEWFGVGEAVPYTYIYEGQTQSLDHILMSEGLFARLTAVEALHINADYPLPLPNDPAPYRVSDHDPLLIILQLQ